MFASCVRSNKRPAESRTFHADPRGIVTIFCGVQAKMIKPAVHVGRVPPAGRLVAFDSWRSVVFDMPISRHFSVNASIEVAAGGTRLHGLGSRPGKRSQEFTKVVEGDVVARVQIEALTTRRHAAAVPGEAPLEIRVTGQIRTNLAERE